MKMFKIWLKICKIQKWVRNISSNNVMKDNTELFLKIVNKALSAYAKKSRKNGYYVWWFISWFVSCSE